MILLIALRCTWDENSIDFFFFLGIRYCVMSVMNRKMSGSREGWENEKTAERWTLTFTSPIGFYLAAKLFVQGLKMLLIFYLFCSDQHHFPLLRVLRPCITSVHIWDNWCAILPIQSADQYRAVPCFGRTVLLAATNWCGYQRKSDFDDCFAIIWSWLASSQSRRLILILLIVHCFYISLLFLKIWIKFLSH